MILKIVALIMTPSYQLVIRYRWYYR